MKNKKTWLIVLVVIGLSAFLLRGKIALFFASERHTINQETLTFYIDAPMKLESLADSLFDKGCLKRKGDLILVGEYKGLDEDNIALGKYEIQPGMNLKTLLNGFTLNSNGNGNGELEVDVTFNNCLDVYELAGKVAQSCMVDSTELIEYLLSDETLNHYGFTEETVGTLFLPNTYRMFWDVTPESFIQRMAKEYKRFWNPHRVARVKQIGLETQSEVVTIASIVYAEQNRKPEEWPRIAGLYLNRVRRGMLLQSDPTSLFCLPPGERKQRRVLRKHTQLDCPYNTYKYPGVPPGPILIPPSKVIEAVLNAEEHNYIFMCAKPEYSGLHNFSTTNAQHERYAAVYRRWLNEQGIR
ncbi:UPF0755 protein [Lishizhenia tianjinensis]|uniref:Endolytic murein transglycosylase n=1 Tax=Lishizhenia tianjinensis TaxID=477690 RepID=A0A1I6X932_9FLAO|nr:endolytic transglycosylase MltG [Lishizhenia tianjinensis]SFT34817.1 UPF0755 protein [Lishizhenia tianjinensis]